jgi:hypothetical protein
LQTKESWHQEENQRANHENHHENHHEAQKRKSHLAAMQLVLREEKKPLSKFLEEQTLSQAK